MSTAKEAMTIERGERKVREGIVVSNKMDKTVVVAISDRVKHGLYSKVMTRSHKLKAHDENNEAGVGDRVLLMETRPLSATKRWRVVEIIEKVLRRIAERQQEKPREQRGKEKTFIAKACDGCSHQADEGRSRATDLETAAAEQRDEEAADHGGVEPAVRRHAGGDRDRHRQRQLRERIRASAGRSAARARRP